MQSTKLFSTADVRYISPIIEVAAGASQPRAGASVTMQFPPRAYFAVGMRVWASCTGPCEADEACDCTDGTWQKAMITAAPRDELTSWAVALQEPAGAPAADKKPRNRTRWVPWWQLLPRREGQQRVSEGQQRVSEGQQRVSEGQQRVSEGQQRVSEGQESALRRSTRCTALRSEHPRHQGNRGSATVDGSGATPSTVRRTFQRRGFEAKAARYWDIFYKVRPTALAPHG
eukprot:SAG11_NODE_853_length_6874_cov_1.980074_1_plen_230_part_00